MGWEQLAGGVALPLDDVPIPPLTEIELAMPAVTPITDVEAAARAAGVTRWRDRVTPGMTIAVGAGSRGLAGRIELLRGTIAALRDLGAATFVVPAMGSHGGATAEGQVATLAALGITADTVGAEIRATMETEVVAAGHADGIGAVRLYLDRHAAAADAIVAVNRVKSHTSFHGPVESGCAKMAVVGFGKQAGAADFHSTGPARMAARLLAAIRALRESGRLLGGMASVESAGGEIVAVEALDADDVGGPGEIALMELARSLAPGLPFREIDVLIVEEGGKDISGTTMDPNVTGRFWIDGLPEPPQPRVASIILLALTQATAGNATGIGFADFVPASLAATIDWEQTYLNCFTAGPLGVRRARLPMVLPDEAACIRAALATCGRGPDEPKRVLRIRSTARITPCWVSPALLEEMPAAAERRAP